MIQTDEDNAHLLGVCAGLGKAMEIDPFFIRLAFAIFTIMGGCGFIMYLILWLIMDKN
jgi:phage shock protein PspC (stress-responsive transcriptional regulator)